MENTTNNIKVNRPLFVLVLLVLGVIINYLMFVGIMDPYRNTEPIYSKYLPLIPVYIFVLISLTLWRSGIIRPAMKRIWKIISITALIISILYLVFSLFAVVGTILGAGFAGNDLQFLAVLFLHVLEVLSYGLTIWVARKSIRS